MIKLLLSAIGSRSYIGADSNDSTKRDTQGADNAGRAWYAAYRAGRANRSKPDRMLVETMAAANHGGKVN